MMNEAYTLWSDLEKESDTALYTYAPTLILSAYSNTASTMHALLHIIFRRTGIIVFGPRDCEEVKSVAESLSKNKVPHDVFSGHDANIRYPHQLRLPDDYYCVYEDGGGILNSQNALMAFQVR